MSVETSQPAHGGLRAGALRAGDVVVLALASSGPTQSIAVTLAALLATIGYASFLPLLICFIPMLGIAIGHQRLNAWQPSAGVTYSRVGRALNPHAGFFAGWIMLMYYTVGTTSLTIPLGSRAPGQLLVHPQRSGRLQGADLRRAAGHLPVLRLGYRRLRRRGGAGPQGRPGRGDQRRAAVHHVHRRHHGLPGRGSISFAMGRDRVFPRWFAVVSAKHRTPWNATILLGLLNVVFLWASTLIGPIGTALGDIVSTLGLMAAIFYLLTAGTAVWYYRRAITSSAASFVLGGVLPGLGAAFMAFVIIYSLASGSLDGVEIVFGFGLALVGLVLSFVAQRTGHSSFYTDPATSHGDQVDEELAGPQPA
jgi:amino acid transporter